MCVARLQQGGHSLSRMSREIVAAYWQDKGSCVYQEDRVVCLQELPGSSKISSFFAVYDGHGGFKASQYCFKHLHHNLMKELTQHDDITSSLVEAFKTTDRKFLKKFEDGGTTAIVAAFTREGQLFVANAGDSRAVLYCSTPDEAIVPMSFDHKPTEPSEKLRIERADHEVLASMELISGKRIKTFRIDGVLACSRSIGDSDFKMEFHLRPEEMAVTCVPDVKCRNLKPTDQFLVLACDGLWDVMTNEDVGAFVRSRLYDGRLSSDTTEAALSTVAQALVNEAVLNRGSPDNTSVVLVALL